MHAIHNKLRDSDRDTVRCSGEAHRGKYTQKHKQNGTQRVKDIQKQQERLINGDPENYI